MRLNQVLNGVNFGVTRVLPDHLSADEQKVTSGTKEANVLRSLSVQIPSINCCD